MEQATLQNSKLAPFRRYLIIRSVYIFSVPDAFETTEHPDEIVLDGIVWRMTGDVVVDLNGPAFQRQAALYHHVVERSTELDFWRMMMPEDLLQNIIEATNQQAEMRFKPLNYEQLQQFFGIILAMTIAGGGERRGQSQMDHFQPLLLGDICLEINLTHCCVI